MANDDAALAGQTDRASVAALYLLLDSFVAIASERDTDSILEQAVDLARLATRARYGAAVLLRHGKIASFVHRGMTRSQVEAMPHLPRGRGLLAAVLEAREPIRLERLQDHPSSVGFPLNHVPMTAFLGVQVISEAGTIGAIYLTKAPGQGTFSEQEELFISALARQTAVALTTVGLMEEKERTTAEIAARETQLAEAQAVAHIGSWNWDVPADVVTWSDELHRMFGVERDSSVLTYETYLQKLHPEDRDMVDQIVRRSFVSGEPFAFDHRIVRPAGEVRWLHGRGQVVRDDQGQTVRMFGTAQDITERKLAEERAAELDRLKTDFISVASHELLTPLTPIRGLASALHRNWGDTTDEQRLESVAAIDRQARRLANLANALLTMSRIEAGALESRTKTLLVASPIEQAIESLEGGGAVEVECPPDLMVDADPEYLAEVLVNFLDNAQKYGDPPVEIHARDEGDAVVIEVRDAGDGVPDKLVPRLFERFAQARSGGLYNRGGSGLGLSIARGLARAQGGDVWYEAGEPRGARFLVRLPGSRHAAKSA